MSQSFRRARATRELTGLVNGAALVGLGAVWSVLDLTALEHALAATCAIVGLLVQWAGLQLGALTGSGSSRFSPLQSHVNAPDASLAFSQFVILCTNMRYLFILTLVAVAWGLRKHVAPEGSITFRLVLLLCLVLVLPSLFSFAISVPLAIGIVAGVALGSAIGLLFAFLPAHSIAAFALLAVVLLVWIFVVSLTIPPDAQGQYAPLSATTLGAGSWNWAAVVQGAGA